MDTKPPTLSLWGTAQTKASLQHWGHDGTVHTQILKALCLTDSLIKQKKYKQIGDQMYVTLLTSTNYTY